MARSPTSPINAGTGNGGDRNAAFAAQFRDAYRPLWLTAAGILGNPTLAEDVVQEAAIIALDKLDQFQPGSNFPAWVGQIVRNVARNRVRKERGRRTASVDPETMEQMLRRPAGTADPSAGSPPRGTPANVPVHHQIDRRILEALTEVSDIARACLLLRTLEGMEYTRISELLQIPEGTAMSHVHRTRKYLRQRLADMAPETGPRGGHR